MADAWNPSYLGVWIDPGSSRPAWATSQRNRKRKRKKNVKLQSLILLERRR
jgi:hypothetical protein